MAFVLGDRPVRPLTADEALRMVELGIVAEDGRLELLHGMLTEKAVKSPQHGELKTRLAVWLAGFAEFKVRVEEPLRVADPTSLPEPDIAVVEQGDYLHVHPTGALLVIEVAKTSLKIDTEIKPPLYAATGVPDCWVVDVNAKGLRIYRDPTPDGYTTETALGPDGHVEPLLLDIPPLDLAALFDGL